MGGQRDLRAVEAEHDAEHPVAEPRGARRDDVEHRLHVGRRARHHAQDLGGRRLLLEGLGELVVLVQQLLGAHADLLLEAARQLLDGLEALRAIDRHRDVVGDGGDQLQVAVPERRIPGRHDQDPDHLVLHAERHDEQRAIAELRDGRAMDRLRRGVQIVDDDGQPRDRHLADHAVLGIERELHPIGQPLRPRVARRDLVPAHDGVRAIHHEEVGGLVPHAVHQPRQPLLVDLLGIEGRVHGRAQLDQQRELLDLRLQLPEFLLELVVGVDDLLALEIEQLLRALAALALPEPVADRDARERMQDRHRGRARPRQGGAGVHRRPQDAGAPDPGDRGHPEPRPERRVAPAHLEHARVGAGGRALRLGDPGARELPVGRIALERHLHPGARPARHGDAGQRRAPEHRARAADLDDLRAHPSVHLTVEDVLARVQRAGIADAHGVGAEVGPLLPRLPVHAVVPVAAHPPFLVRLAHQLAAEPHELGRERRARSSCGRPSATRASVRRRGRWRPRPRARPPARGTG